MGWFSWFSSDDSKSSDGGRIAPDRSSRERCWEGRDRFFACLDRNNILDAVRDDKGARSKCGKEVEEFEGACAKAWVCFPLFFFFFLTYIYYFFIPYGEKDNSDILQVKYFKEKRVMEYNRDKTIERIKQEDAATKAQGRPN